MKALVDTDLKNLISKKIISSIENIDLNMHIQPASIDIPIGSKAYLVKQKFIPFSQKIDFIIEKVKLEEFDLTNSTLLLKGQTYLIPCLKVDLPENLVVKISPKSSIGRIDVMVRTIFDNLGLYDSILPKNKGELWLEVTPQSFNIKLQKGICLSQLRFFLISNSQEEKKTKEKLEKTSFLFDNNGNTLKHNFHNTTLFLGLDVSPNSLIGYEALPTNNIIDLSKEKAFNSNKFFKEIKTSSKGKLLLEKDKFYILHTKELISIPYDFSMEMIPFSHLIGELRVHYAGFFDPGFGNKNGCVGVLEIRPHENITIYDGQPICQIEFFENSKKPETPYGEKNNYQNQKGPKLSKYFIDIKEN